MESEYVWLAESGPNQWTIFGQYRRTYPKINSSVHTIAVIHDNYTVAMAMFHAYQQTRHLGDNDAAMAEARRIMGMEVANA